LRLSPHRRGWFRAVAVGASACALYCAFAVSVSLLGLVARLDGDYLRISLPHVDFLSGKALERLKDGASVAFIGQLTVSTSPNVVEARAIARFALSYDIWEERFSVTKIGENPESRRSGSHLSAQATENWFLENLVIDRSRLPENKPFWVQLDFRVEDPRDQAAVIGDPGINITRLIEVFSRPARGQQQRWVVSGGPYWLSELKKAEIKGTRG
jgi:hypothetical protein